LAHLLHANWQEDARWLKYEELVAEQSRTSMGKFSTGMNHMLRCHLDDDKPLLALSEDL
jgi:hypothetical protein